MNDRKIILETMVGRKHQKVNKLLKMIEVPLTKNRFALIDYEDGPLVLSHKWHCLKTGYAATSIGGRKNRKMLYMHRLILCVVDKKITVDHINKDKLDNRRINLRICTHRENCRNSSKSKNPKTSKFKGVFFDKSRSLWQAKIKVNEKNIYLGRFLIETDAAKAYNDAAAIYFGDFACPNKL